MVCTAALSPIGEAATDAECRKLMRADVLQYGDRGPYLAGTGYEYTASIAMARSANKRLTVVPRTDTQALDPRYPTGVPPVSVPVIVVAAPPTLTGTAGSAFSQNLASYVTGADASGYVMSLVAVTGTAAALGLSLSTTTVSGTAVQGSFTYQLRVTKSGFTFDAPQSSLITINPAVVADTLAPTVPKFLTATLDSTALTITLAGDYPMDNRTATISPTDPVKVEIYESVDSAAFTLLTTKTAAGSQPSLVMSGSAIGGATLATFAQSGGDITISNVVDGSYGRFAESCNFYSGLASMAVGDRVIVTLPAYSSGSAYSEGGLMIRAGLTTMEPSLAILRRPDGVNSACPLLSRATQGGDTTYTTDATCVGEVDAVIQRLASNQWRFDTYDATGGLINTSTTQTVVLPTLVRVGVYLNRNIAGAAISAVFKNFSINSQGRWSHVRSGVVNSHSYAYKVRGADSNP